MISTLHTEPDAAKQIEQTNAIAFVKEALIISQEMQPCINIDALFCLNNLMNIEELAKKPTLLNEDTLDNALVIYFAYREQMPLDECIITYLYSISRYEEYQLLMKRRCKVL